MAGGIDQLDLSPLRPDVRAVVEQLLAGAATPQLQVAQPLSDWQLITLMATHLVAAARSAHLPSTGNDIFAKAAREAHEIFGETVALYQTGLGKEALSRAAEQLKAEKLSDGHHPGHPAA